MVDGWMMGRWMGGWMDEWVNGRWMDDGCMIDG